MSMMMVILLTMSLLDIGDANPNNVEEYCLGIINARCMKDEVIVMKSARYGRMRLGKCVNVDYGYIGCSADVLQIMDNLCSGKQYCIINIPADELEAINSSCPKELRSYLYVAYECVQVTTASKINCIEGDSLDVVIPLNTNTGYLSSSIITTCPWRISAQKGQKINLTLFDFSVTTNMQMMPVCKVYMILTEVPNGAITVCGGHTHDKVIYTSKEDEIKIKIVGANGANRFIVKYEAIGCPLITAPKYGFVKHEGHRAAVHCNGTEEIRHLVCNGTKWIGEIGTCPAYEEIGELSVSQILEDIDHGEKPVGEVLQDILSILETPNENGNENNEKSSSRLLRGILSFFCDQQKIDELSVSQILEDIDNGEKPVGEVMRDILSILEAPNEEGNEKSSSRLLRGILSFFCDEQSKNDS